MALPVPAAYISDFEQLGFGMFVHFGLYSQLVKGEWALNSLSLDKAEYEALKNSFSVPTMADIVNTAKSAGCRYITLTTRHHDGFSLYDTKGLCPYDVMDTPTGRDLVGEFVSLCREADIVPFFYHTTLDWHKECFNDDFDGYLDYLYKSVELLCTNYGPIGGLWFDGNWSRPDADWKEDRLYAMIRSHQPNAMIINNTGIDARGSIGEVEIDAVTFERGMPSPLDRSNHKKYITGEMCETICDYWGIADDINYKSVKTLIEELCHCRKVGANFLLNIGPDGNGNVPLMQKATMECIGRWMRDYGKAIYNGRPFVSLENDRCFVLKDVKDEKTAYLFCLDPGNAGADVVSGRKDGWISLGELKVESAVWMDDGAAIDLKEEDGVAFAFPKGFEYGRSLCVRVAELKLK